MYVARAWWQNDSSPESLNQARKGGAVDRSLRGILYQERVPEE